MHRRRRRRALATALILAALSVAGVVLSSAGSGPAAGVLRLTSGTTTLLRIPTSRYIRAGRLQRAALRHALAAVLSHPTTVVDARSQSTYRYDAKATFVLAASLGSSGGDLAAVRRVISTRIQAPVRRQQQANTCEAAALSILLSTLGRNLTEQQIQQALPISGTPDPQGSGPTRVWGDPDRGYVGRPDSGGVAGGFGVYPRPVIATAAHFGVRLHDLTGQPPSAVYRSLLHGHAVMAWVALSDGPFGSWTSPQGRPITVNFGEHTVILHGIRVDGALLVSNPLKGTREIWTAATFQHQWTLLGRRAITT